MAMLFVEYLDCFFGPSLGQMLNTLRYYKKFIHYVTISVTYLAQHKSSIVVTGVNLVTEAEQP